MAAGDRKMLVGSRNRIKRGYPRRKNKLPLLVRVLINAQSLKAKADALIANIGYLNELWSACVMQGRNFGSTIGGVNLAAYLFVYLFNPFLV